MATTRTKTLKSNGPTESELIEEAIRLGKTARNVGEEVTNLLSHGKPVSVVELARQLGQNKRTVALSCEQLIDHAVLECGFVKLNGRRCKWVRLAKHD